MTFRLLILACVLQALAFAAAAADDAYVFSGEAIPAHKKLRVLPDPGGKLDIRAVRSADAAGRFVPAPSITAKDIKPGTYWLRLTLENPVPAKRTIALFPIALWREFQVYSAADTSIPRRSGLDVPIEQRDLEVTRRA